MSKIEQLLDREEQSQHYEAVAKALGDTVGRDYPSGYWDSKHKRFLDWIDCNGEAHDHIHLLANELPVLFGLADEEQTAECIKTIENHRDIFSKFPSFVAAKIEDYTGTEIGVGGPYDLCAAGRYWCWDAEFKAYLKDGDSLKEQLLQVARQAELDDYLMGERYDMNYIYYNTGEEGKKNWHGASKYYEYPNVFLYVLVCKFLGVSYAFDSDLVINPLLKAPGNVVLENHGVSYTLDDKFTLKNIGNKPLLIELPFINERITLNAQEIASYSV